MNVSGNCQAVRTSQHWTITRKPAARVSIFAVLVSVLSFFSLSAVQASTSSHLARLETLVFSTPIESFMQITLRRTGGDASFDWTTDRCSAPLVGSTGRSFDFTAACSRHDFAYRNYKRADAAASRPGHLWNSHMRHRIDQRFRHDMRGHCSRRAITERGTCFAWAELFYRLVRVAGGP